MQVLLSVIHDSPELATGAEMAAIDEFNDQLIAQGQWIFAGGLGSSTGVVDNRGPEMIVTDGPFLESKEYLALHSRGRRRAGGAGPGHSRVQGLQPQDRGSSVHVVDRPRIGRQKG